LTRAWPEVGIVGAGSMGGAIARRLLRLGASVVVHDIDAAARQAMAAAGAAVAASAADAAARTAVTLLCVVDAGQMRDALFGPGGVTEGARPGHAVLLMSTIAPADVEDAAARLAGAGIGTLDAPMSGGPQRAEAGTMSLIVAGPVALRERLAPLLAALADPVFDLGERVGDGARTKLVNNLLAAVHLAAAGEAMQLARRMGLDVAATLAVVERSSGQSWIAGDRLHRALAGDVAPRARLALLRKDAGLALAEAAAVGLAMPVGSAASAAFEAAAAAGLAQADDSVLVRGSTDRAGG